eukprot:scaffold289148_cov26-Tisochrysis_lutea.AAC.2
MRASASSPDAAVLASATPNWRSEAETRRVIMVESSTTSTRMPSAASEPLLLSRLTGILS